MSVEDLAEDLVDAAVAAEQVARRIGPDIDLTELRRLVRAAARIRQVRIRTAVLDDRVLAVVLVDAAIWHDPVAVMRTKLSPPQDG